MTPLAFTLCTLAVAIGAGVFGALLGLGGGIIVIPALTLGLGVDIRLAIGASIVSVIATSSGAAASYVRAHLANMRLGMLLEASTTIGALSGATLAGILSPRWLYLVFSVVMAYTAVEMLRGPQEERLQARPDPMADYLRLHGSYFDPAAGKQVVYRVSGTKFGLGVSFLAGAVSGLLGIGGGPIKVPAMHLGMGVPMKAATATSNFMIGVTAAASAGVYFSRGEIVPFVAAPVAAGVLTGALIGSRLLGRLHSRRIRTLFVLVLAYISVQMFWRGTH